MKYVIFKVNEGYEMKEYAIVIPAYQPIEDLDSYVWTFIQADVARVIVIDDGNDSSYEALFARISAMERCTVLRHTTNSGKGAGLKTAIRYFLKHFPELKGIVTADADAQHLTADVLNVGRHLEKLEDGFVLGSRVYESKNMPTRSLIGNTISSRLFHILFGLYIRDTQTGLRGITTSELDLVLDLSGDHFEFEMNMLINMVKKECRIIQVDIKAVYQVVHISHFSTVKDSVRIAGQIWKGFIT